jgi:hypothetical protein
MIERNGPADPIGVVKFSRSLNKIYLYVKSITITIPMRLIMIFIKMIIIKDDIGN